MRVGPESLGPLSLGPLGAHFGEVEHGVEMTCLGQITFVNGQNSWLLLIHFLMSVTGSNVSKGCV